MQAVNFAVKHREFGFTEDEPIKVFAITYIHNVNISHYSQVMN